MPLFGDPINGPTQVRESALWTLGVLWSLFMVAIGIAIGSQHTAGLAIRDSDDAVYYRAMTDTLMNELVRCGSTLHGSVRMTERAQETIGGFLKRRVVIQATDVREIQP